MALPYFGMTSAQDAAAVQPDTDSSIKINSGNSGSNMDNQNKLTGVTSSNATDGTFHAPDTVDTTHIQPSILPMIGNNGESQIIQYQITRSAWWVPSQHLRYLKRGDELILQQLWYDSVTTHMTKPEKEWRDIPIVVEGSPEDK